MRPRRKVVRRGLKDNVHEQMAKETWPRVIMLHNLNTHGSVQRVPSGDDMTLTNVFLGFVDPSPN